MSLEARTAPDLRRWSTLLAAFALSAPACGASSGGNEAAPAPQPAAPAVNVDDAGVAIRGYDSPDIQREWETDIEGHIRDADTYWPKLAGEKR